MLLRPPLVLDAIEVRQHAARVQAGVGSGALRVPELHVSARLFEVFHDRVVVVQRLALLSDGFDPLDVRPLRLADQGRIVLARPEVTETEGRRIERLDRGQVPETLVEIELRRRRGRSDRIDFRDVDPGGVGGEHDAGVRLVVKGVVRGVTGRLVNHELAVTQIDPVSLCEPRNAVFGDRDGFVVVLPLISDSGFRAGDERVRIDEMSDPLFRQANRGVLVTLGEVTRAARVVEVGVRGEDPRDRLAVDAYRLDRLEQRLAVRARAGVDHGRALGVVHVHGAVLVGVEHSGVVDVQVVDAPDRLELASVHTGRTTTRHLLPIGPWAARHVADAYGRAARWDRMRALVTGATGFVGSRLIPALLEQGHEVVALVRDADSYAPPAGVRVVEGDLLEPDTLPPAFEIDGDPVDVAYYLVHSMDGGPGYEERDRNCAQNFVDTASAAGVDRIVYLGGLGEDREALSEHLKSRREVERILATGDPALTTLRAAIIVGAGSASFEVIYGLASRLPVMTTPKWVDTLCQPIAIDDVVEYLVGTLDAPATAGDTFEIGGPNVLTYAEILRRTRHQLGHTLRIVRVPVLSPELSAKWLRLVTDVNPYLARSLVEGLRNTVIVEDDRIHDHVSVDQTPFEVAAARAIDELKRPERRTDAPETPRTGNGSPAGSGDETPAGKQS